MQDQTPPAWAKGSPARVSTETLYSLEHGKRQPTVKTRPKLARALDVDIKEFF